MKAIRAKSVCLFRNQGKVLLAECFDPAKNEKYLSPVGGGIEFGERSADAAVREVKEELNAEVHNLKLLDIAENLFFYNGRECHEIVFIYEADFKDESFYQKGMIWGAESNGDQFEARWYEVEGLTCNGVSVYPGCVLAVL